MAFVSSLEAGGTRLVQTACLREGCDAGRHAGKELQERAHHTPT